MWHVFTFFFSEVMLLLILYFMFLWSLLTLRLICVLHNLFLSSEKETASYLRHWTSKNFVLFLLKGKMKMKKKKKKTVFCTLYLVYLRKTSPVVLDAWAHCPQNQHTLHNAVDYDSPDTHYNEKKIYSFIWTIFWDRNRGFYIHPWIWVQIGPFFAMQTKTHGQKAITYFIDLAKSLIYLKSQFKLWSSEGSLDKMSAV